MYKISIEKLAPNWYRTSVSLSLSHTPSFLHFLTHLYSKSNSYVTMIFKMNAEMCNVFGINLEFECNLMMTIRKQWTTRNHTTYMFIFAEMKWKTNHRILSIYTRSKWKKSVILIARPYIECSAQFVYVFAAYQCGNQWARTSIPPLTIFRLFSPKKERNNQNNNTKMIAHPCAHLHARTQTHAHTYRKSYQNKRRKAIAV